MSSIKPNVLPKPPSLMRSLLAGFDTISNNVVLILFSVILDLLLWFGPRISLGRLLKPFFNTDQTLSELQSAEIMEMMQAAIQDFNLLSILRTFPIGAPSLLAARVTLDNPVGSQFVVEPQSLGNSFLLWFLLMGVGVGFGTLYFDTVAQAALTEKINFRNSIKNWLWSYGQILLLTIAWFILIISLLIPFSCIFSMLLFLGAQMQTFALITALIVGGLLIWLLIPLAFSPHGIFVKHHLVWQSMKDSIRMTRLTLPTTSLFLLAVVILSEGLNVLWNIPAEDSWWFLVGILGHAFITASLLAASFVYYQEANQWAERFVEEMKKSLV
jgi:hypothetical protein